MADKADRTVAKDVALERLQVRIRKELNDLADALATGNAQSFGQYQHMVGTIKGLAMAERALLDLDVEMTNEEIESDAA